MDTTRRTAAVVVAAVLLLGGCGREAGAEGQGGAPGEAGAGENRQGVPAELIGSWTTDHASAFEPTVHSFYEDGFFTREVGTIRVTGRYEVRGSTILTYPDKGQPEIHEWRMGDGGCLYLDGAKHCPYS
ncbi:hypothetical protein GCM10010420_31320 [Streptomyces glaucosporus]|uniref:Lipoprotein n=1 Tax=Streptomyces glaucosporus TaxID=284044 RepID=A0ABP5VI12_9ACTN